MKFIGSPILSSHESAYPARGKDERKLRKIEFSSIAPVVKISKLTSN